MDKDKNKRSLYDEALDRFRKEAAERYTDSKQVKLLSEFLSERATPEETKDAAEALQGDSGKKWGSRKVGGAEIPETWISNIMTNIESFVAAGDFVTNNAPETVGMAWFAIKLTLTAIHGNYDLYTFFGTGLSDISEIMIIVRHYDRLYDERSKPEWKPSPLVEKLFQDVIGAYAAVLDFSFAIKLHLTAGALTRIRHGFKDFFGVSKIKFEDKMDAVSTLKTRILEESQGAFQDKTLTQLESVSTVLAGIEDTVQHIQGFQDTQRKLHEDAMARFDVLVKGLDDIRASTKRKSRWDYALQDYQAFQDALSPLEGSIKVYGDTIDAVYPGTCQWVFDELPYKRWADSADNAMLCVTGPEGSGKSYVVASIAHRKSQDDDEQALLYVTCSGASGGGLETTYTADSVSRTLLSQLYYLAAEDGEEKVGLLEACNAVFASAKEKNPPMKGRMRTDSSDLPEFVDGFSRIAALVNKNLVLVLDGLDRNSLDDRNQEELLLKIQDLMASVSEKVGIRLRLLIGCAPSARFFTELDPPSHSYIDVQHNNWRDMELVLTDALKDVPGLSSAEQEAAKAAILEKARSRFVYVRDTAIPFMLEPFQRPLSKHLEALPDGANDVYSKALHRMSPNYLDLLRTALTWTLLSPEFPGLPQAREVMDAFHGVYDLPPETVAEDEDGDVEAEFPATSRLEMDQLREATDPFLALLLPEQPGGPVWVYEADELAVHDYFLKSGTDIPEEPEEHAQLCARCGSTRSSVRQLYIDPKQGHLQMALTCLRHLNNPLFQRRAGLMDAPVESKSAEKEEDDGYTPEQLLEAAQNGYHTEESIDDEDVTEEVGFYDPSADDYNAPPAEESDDSNKRATRDRYELEYWPWHMRNAEQLWPAEERETNSDWTALMKELDKFVFGTPQVFAVWQSKYPTKETEHETFSFGKGPHKPLHAAAYLGLSSWAKYLLSRGQELNELSAGYSPLQVAACSDALDTVKLLLEKGADANVENGAGRTAFHLWLLVGDITVDGARTFLEHRANPRLHCSQAHYNALQYFANNNRGKDPQILDLLLDHGADLNAPPEDIWKLSPLHVLLMRRDVPRPLLQAFVERGADTNWENRASARPLQMVCSYGHLEDLRILLQSKVVEIDDPDIHGTTAVHEAAFYGHVKCATALLEHNADPDVPDKLQRTALHTTARKGLTETVRVLLQYTKRPNHLDKEGWTPLFCACLSNDEPTALLILDALIERNIPLAEINKPTRTGRTVLRQAADHGFTQVLTKLIHLATSPNSHASLALNTPDTKKHHTPLHRAAKNGHATTVLALLSAGASPSPLDTHHKTPLTLAHTQYSLHPTSPTYPQILTALILADPPTAITDPNLPATCAANGALPLLTLLSRLNAAFDKPDRFGWTPLQLAQRSGRSDVEAWLRKRLAEAGRGRLPARWDTEFPGTTPVGRGSVCDGGRRVVHRSGRRVCVAAERPLPPGEGFYFEVVVVAGGEEGGKEGEGSDGEGEGEGSDGEGEGDGDEGEQAGKGEENGEEKGEVEELVQVVEVQSRLAKHMVQQWVEVGEVEGQSRFAKEMTEMRVEREEEEEKRYPDMAIGFCTLGGAALVFPGWEATSDSPSKAARSWGYHSRTGGVYSSLESSESFVDDGDEELKYGIGDAVGCGVDFEKGEIWFTKNGVKLEKVIKGELEGRLFPVVGLHDTICFETNFGGEGDGEFMWKPEVEDDEDEKEGVVMEIAVVGGKGEAEKGAGVQVTSVGVN